MRPGGTAIGDYALLSDCHAAALVSREGSVDWVCFPRFDSPAVFARLLGEDAGHWSIRPVAPARVTRRYLPNSLVLETRFETTGGSATLCDALAVGEDAPGHELGAGAPRALVRRVSCTRGDMTFELEYAPRPEYGLVHPLLSALDGGVLSRGSASVLLLSTPIPLRLEDSVARARWPLRQGESIAFALQHRTTSEPEPSPWSPASIAERLRRTREAWVAWSRMHQSYEGPWKEWVHHSGRVLQGLTYHPTGAIVAAATTSLPETVGGSRNWDYRYTWVRDAALTLDALWVAACPDEAHRFFDFLAHASLTQIRRGEDLQIMFGIGGEHDLTEREIPLLPGWRGSRPVRVGNGAWQQRQLDVYGELLGAAHRLRHLLGGMHPSTRQFLVEAAEAAGSRWKQKDQGIWEIRGEPRDYVYSKLMCWVALDRAIALAPLLGTADRVPRWTRTREEIRAAILGRGFSARAQSFTQAFGTDDLDASNLVMPVVGFLPATDPRMRATIEAVERRLTDPHGLVYRYRAPDGLGGEEGSFLLCTFWLAQAWALAGETGRARRVFERAAAFVNDVGLLSEEVDPVSGQLLGNFPQAFSHIGLVNAAWTIAQVEGRGAFDTAGTRLPQEPAPMP